MRGKGFYFVFRGFQYYYRYIKGESFVGKCSSILLSKRKEVY